MTDNNNTITVSLSLTNPPRRVPLSLPSPAPSLTLHKLASETTTIPLSSIRLIFRGRIIPALEEGNVIESFKLEDGCVVHCMGKPAVPAAANSNAASSASVAATTASSMGSSGSVVTPPPAVASTTTAAVASSNSADTTTTQNVKHPLTIALEGMKSNHSHSEYTTALNTISKILSNIISNPTEEKYRKVKRSNAAFTKRLGRLTNSHEAMTSIGFISSKSPEGNDEYSLVPNADAWTKLTMCKKIIDEMITKNNNNNNQQAGNNVNTNTTNVAGLTQDMGFGAIPPTNNMFPNMNNNMGSNNLPPPSQMMESMLSNPAALQSMLSNPMIQNMITNDPRMRNNPMMQNSMREMLNNPAMIQRMTQMMSDPNVRSRMDDLMQQSQQGGFDGFSGVGSGGAATNNNNSVPDMAAQMEMMRQFANMTSMSNTTSTQQNTNQQSNNNNNQSQQNNGSNGEGEREMTEEEMIAEAIARSLREQ